MLKLPAREKRILEKDQSLNELADWD